MPAQKKTNAILDDQSGFVLVMAILILVALAIIGISTTKDAQIGLLIAGNDKRQKQIFYRGEASVQEAAQRVFDATTDQLRYFTLPGLTMKSTLGVTDQTTADQLATIINKTFQAPSVFTPATSILSNASATSSYLIIDNGIDEGGSLSMTESKVHSYDLYGYSSENNGNSVISIGYKKRW